MSKQKDIYIVRDGVRYRLVKGRDCTSHCSFRNADNGGHADWCSRKCHLPKWFTDLKIGVDCWLEREEPEAEMTRKVRKCGECKHFSQFAKCQNVKMTPKWYAQSKSMYSEACVYFKAKGGAK